MISHQQRLRERTISQRNKPLSARSILISSNTRTINSVFLCSFMLILIPVMKKLAGNHSIGRCCSNSNASCSTTSSCEFEDSCRQVAPLQIGFVSLRHSEARSIHEKQTANQYNCCELVAYAELKLVVVGPASYPAMSHSTLCLLLTLRWRRSVVWSNRIVTMINNNAQTERVSTQGHSILL